MTKKIPGSVFCIPNLVNALVICFGIFLWSTLPSHAGDSVAIGGGVTRPGEYSVARTGTLLALLAASGNVTDGAGVERAGLIRGEPGKESQWVFDLYKLLARKGDIKLLKGDRVYIPACVMMGAGGIAESEMKAWNHSLSDLEEARKGGRVKFIWLKAQ